VGALLFIKKIAIIKKVPQKEGICRE